MLQSRKKNSVKDKVVADKKKKQLEKFNKQLQKQEWQESDCIMYINMADGDYEF